MLVPLQWLRDYVDFDLEPKRLAHLLTMAGNEVDRVIHVGSDWQHIYVGQVLTIERHPNADRLLLVKASYGEGELTVVTGASNFAVGDKVPVALVGARLIDGHSADHRVITLKPSKLRGIESQGMLCSSLELGLGDDHSGIMILHPESEVGKPLAEALGEVIFDFQLTPNRSDCLSIVGIAREVAAVTGGAVKHPSEETQEAGPAVSEVATIEVADPDLCPRYTAMVIEGVTIAPSPRWLQQRLVNAGVRPISNVVDVTNYVMLEMGQPLHAFDLDKVAEHRVIVRRARPGEKMTTLDGVERNLNENMLLITDPEKVIGLAGVMGGLNSEIDDGTTRIVLESATFDAHNNRLTARALNLPTEASRRFEKGLPLELAPRAAHRAMRLIHQLAGGTVATGILDSLTEPPTATQLLLPNGEIKRLLGVEYPPERVTAILHSLEFQTKDAAEGLLVTVPPHRVDVSLPADLVEEVARIVGYENIPDTLLSGTLPPQEINVELAAEMRLRSAMVAGGFSEIIGYALTSRERQARLLVPSTRDTAIAIRGQAGSAPEPLPAPLPPLLDPALYDGTIEPLLLANTLSSDSDTMRTTPFVTMLETLRDNLRRVERDVNLFELGRIYLRSDDVLPDERKVVSFGMGELTSRGAGHRNSFFELKGAVESALTALGVADYHFAPLLHPLFHPGRAALLIAGEPGSQVTASSILGMLGEVHRDVAAAFDIDSQRVFAGALDLALALEHAGSEDFYRPLSRYPSVAQDIAVAVDEQVNAEALQQAIIAAGGELLQSVQLFDIYRGDQVEKGKKSLAFNLIYQAHDHTLTDAEVNKVHRRIAQALIHRFEAAIRGD